MSLQSELAQGQLRAAEDTLVCGGIAGLGGVAVDISGTFVGTITFEGQIASGAWTALNMVRSNGSTVVTTATTAGLFIGSCVGLTAVRTRMSAFTSGIAAVSIQASLASAGGSGGGGGGGGGAVTIADGADVVEGELADAAITTDTTGTVNGKLRGLIKLQNALDYDTGGGTVQQGIVGIALPGSGGPVGVSGSNPLPVTGTVATGGLTDTQLRATPVPVSGTVTASGPLTDTQLRATPVPVSGTVTTGGLTDTQLRASAVPITGSGTAGTAASGVQTVQGIASMTPVQVSQATAASLNATVVGSGAAGTAATGVITVQGIASMTKLLVTPDANSAVNVAQINGVTPLMGAGNSGTGALRVSVSTDDINLAAINAVSGVTTGTKVITDAAGTLQQYLRGLIYLMITTGNYPEKAFYGTAQTCINTATDIAAGNFSGAPSATFDNTTTDAAVPYARYAKAVLSMPDWAAAPVAGTTVDLYGLLIDVDGSNDDTDAPSGSASGGARFFGSFVIAAADALQRRTITINLEGVEKVDFYIKNGTAQNMNNDGGTSCILKVTPLAYGIVA